VLVHGGAQGGGAAAGDRARVALLGEMEHASRRPRVGNQHLANELIFGQANYLICFIKTARGVNQRRAECLVN
jgi:hypothetical protein